MLDPDRALVVAIGPSAVAPALRALADTTVLPSRGARGDELAAVVQLERTFDVLGGRARWARLKVVPPGPRAATNLPRISSSGLTGAVSRLSRVPLRRSSDQARMVSAATRKISNTGSH